MKHQFNLFYSLEKLLSNTTLFSLKKKRAHTFWGNGSTDTFHFLLPFLGMKSQCLPNIFHYQPFQMGTKEGTPDTLTGGITQTGSVSTPWINCTGATALGLWLVQASAIFKTVCEFSPAQHSHVDGTVTGAVIQYGTL